jgi:hypothetical protein
VQPLQAQIHSLLELPLIERQPLGLLHGVTIR